MNQNYAFLRIFLIIFSFLNSHFLMATPPNWVVNAAAFQYTESVTTQLYVGGTLNNATGNKVGAFVGNDLRGVGTPQIINGKAYYFFTLYANQTAGETVKFKVYLSATDEIKPILETTVFQYNAILGSFTTPFALNMSNLAVNTPPILANIPRDSTLVGIPFADITLLNYFSSTDGDPVSWIVNAGANLNVSISPSKILNVTPVVSGWIGSDTVRVTVIESSTGALSTSKTIWFTVSPDYAAPDIDLNPSQTRAPGETFANFDMDSLLTFGGDCLQHSVSLLPFEATDVKPILTAPQGGAGSMLLTIRADFGNNQPLSGVGHQLAAYIGTTLVGISTPTDVNGVNYYFLVVQNIAQGSLNFNFYDAQRHKIYNQNSTISFVQNGTLGTLSAPKVLQLAPLVVIMGTNGAANVTVLDPTWIGAVDAQFKVKDCNYPLQKNDVQLAQFRVQSALPLELTFFEVKTKDKNLELNWETQSEVKFDGFTIERSENGLDFEEITKIDGKGGQNGATYSFIDKDVKSGILYYYRLKILDLDGSFVYSDIKTGEIKGQFVAHLFPNPAQDFTHISFFSEEEMKADVLFFNAFGQLILKQSLEVFEGENQFTIDIAGLPNGFYFWNFGLLLCSMQHSYIYVKWAV
jgi:hypothetical protein